MARREVTADDVALPGGKFLKFSDVFPEPGSKFRALYQSDKEGTYGQDFLFKLSRGDVDRFGLEERDGGLGVLTAKGPLKAQLLKAKLQAGELVEVTRGDDNAKGFYTFSVVVDDPPKGAKPAKPAPAKAPSWDADEDIPF